MGAVQKKLFVVLFAVGEHRPALPAGNGFHRMKTQGSHIGNGAVPFPLIAGTDYMGPILDQHQPFFPAVRQKLVQLCGLSGIVHSYHRLCPFIREGFHLPGIDIVGFLIDVGKYRFGAAVKRAVCRSGKGNRGSDHLVPLSNPRSHRRHMQSRSAIAAHHRVPGSGNPAEPVF